MTSDWRKSAYLRVENWPEAIPWTGPKREYGPWPWGEPAHHDPHCLDDYPSSHPAAASIGDLYMGDVCPYCGVPLQWDEEVVLLRGPSGRFCDVSDVEKPEPAYHPECWREREATIHGHENATLEAFADGNAEVADQR